MPILVVVKFLFSVILIFLVTGISVKPCMLFAAPLEGGFALAPRSSASQEEKAQSYIAARQRVIEAARKYEGVPYVYGGMTPRGLDCSGFIGLSFRDALGITLPRSASGLYSWSERIPYERAQPGDLLFFRTGSNRNITHVGIYLGNREFIHAASAGARTGVIYSSLNETYWANTFAGAGRAFPEAPQSFNAVNTSLSGASANNGVPGGASGHSRGSQNSPEPESLTRGSGTNTSRDIAPNTAINTEGRLLLGVGIAPLWNGFMPGGNLVRGFSSQLLIGADTHSFGRRMVFGLEVRPEYDGGLGVFRLPITFSWGFTEKIRIFAGPILSVGDAVISVDDNQRYYSNGTSWLGTIGVTAAPFAIKGAGGEFAPYIELAWQSYTRKNSSFNLAADFSAGFRFSTGIRWMMQVK